MTMYRAWRVANPPAEPERFVVASPACGAALIEALAAKDLKDASIHSNAFGLEVLNDDGWEEWYDEDGRDVDEAFGSDARMNESEGIK